MLQKKHFNITLGLIIAFVVFTLFSFTISCEKKEEFFLKDFLPVDSLKDPNTGLPLRIKCKKDGSEMILIPEGEFIMGSNDFKDEKPPHKVHLSSYYIDKHEITFEQYSIFLKSINKNKHIPNYWDYSNYNDANCMNCPIVGVNWKDALAYANWADKELPTEAEWEKAARGPLGFKYPWGNEKDPNKCNSADGPSSFEFIQEELPFGKIDGYKQAAPVGSFPDGKSHYGCFDLAGNVWEWCRDFYQKDYYINSIYKDPKGPPTGKFKVVRGGGWFSGMDSVFLRTTDRAFLDPNENSFDLGFRCVKHIPLK